MDQKIKLADDTITQWEIDQLIRWLEGYPRLTKGELTEQFEQEFAEWMGSKYAVFVNSGSSANLLMMYTLFEQNILSKGDQILIPDLSWATTLAPALQLNYSPILVDCNLEDLSLDLEAFEKAIIENPKARVAIIVPILGLVPNMTDVRDICDKHDVILIEDACESLGSSYQDRKLGTWGLMSSHSMYFGHHMSTIEGGMVCTDDPNLNATMRMIRSHGWARDVSPQIAKNLKKKFKINDFEEQYTFYTAGFNLRSTDLNAFIGLEQMKTIDVKNDHRGICFDFYRERLKVDWKPIKRPDSYTSPFAYPLIHEKRDKIVAALNDNNIECRPLVCGAMGQQPFWVRRYGKVVHKNTDLVKRHGMYLPIHPTLKIEDVIRICGIVNEAIK